MMPGRSGGLTAAWAAMALLTLGGLAELPAVRSRVFPAQAQAAERRRVERALAALERAEAASRQGPRDAARERRRAEDRAEMLRMLERIQGSSARRPTNVNE